jgi:hypothetical protein
MSEMQMLWASLAFEWTVPLVALCLMIRKPAMRRYISVLMGALTPMLIFYVCVAVAYALDPKDKGNMFAFYGMSVMTFYAYVVLLGVGLLLGFLPRPSNLYARYALGFVVAPLCCYLDLKFRLL